MLGRCFALAFLLFFSGKSFAGNDNYTRAADTFKAIEKLYGVEDVPLFRETYPFDNHLKVSYLSNQEQAEQQKLYTFCQYFSSRYFIGDHFHLYQASLIYLRILLMPVVT